MKIACQICDKIVNTEINLKGNTGFEFCICYDNEPHISAVIKKNEKGYLCYECSKKLAKFLKYNS